MFLWLSDFWIWRLKIEKTTRQAQRLVQILSIWQKEKEMTHGVINHAARNSLRTVSAVVTWINNALTVSASTSLYFRLRPAILRWLRDGGTIALWWPWSTLIWSDITLTDWTHLAPRIKVCNNAPSHSRTCTPEIPHWRKSVKCFSFYANSTTTFFIFYF